MKKTISILFSTLFISAFAQTTNKVFTSDIDNYWIAYDSIQKTNDYSKKIELINKLYINKGTKGLKAFTKARNYNDSVYVNLIDQYPKFWNSIRPNTLTIKNKTKELEKSVKKLRKLYPQLKDAEMYFTIGGLRSGGTVTNNMVLVGAEIGMGDKTTDLSEFKNSWLQNTFSTQSLDNIVYLNIHEYIHTQQNGGNNRVLNQSIKEGSCDFIAELVLEKPIKTQYIIYGNQNKNTVKQQFKEEMFSTNLSNWFYNLQTKGESADLGYYVGYEISKAYYHNAVNKKQAIKDIIELDYGNDNAVEDFLMKSNYFEEKIDKEKIIEAYKQKLPFVQKIEPFDNKSTNVDPTIKEMKVVFSKEMDTQSISINFSKNGKTHFPITKIKGFENNDRTIIFIVKLEPNTDYDFSITNRSSKSKDGYQLRDDEYSIEFKTK